MLSRYRPPSGSMVGAINLNRPAVQVNCLVATCPCHITSSLAAATRCSQRARARQTTPSHSQIAAFERNCQVPKIRKQLQVFARKDEFVKPSRGYRQDLFAANGKGSSNLALPRRPLTSFHPTFPFTL